jgi:hypothetical protein
MKREVPRAPTAISWYFRLCDYKTRLPHNLCDEMNERLFEAGVQALLEAADNDPPPSSAKGIRPCILLKFIISVMLRKACKINGIPKECFRRLPRRPLVIWIVLSGILDLVK